MVTYAIWNNKGGTGKTSLTFQSVSRYAELNPQQRILVFDMCPQANLSELMLGGQSKSGSKKLLERQGRIPRCSIGGYFDARLPSPFAPPPFNPIDYITHVSEFNPDIPQNIDLVCGDPLLELQAIAMNTLANNDLPGVNTWLSVIDWVRDFTNKVSADYNMIFIDTNPSFAMYTQIALSSADRIILPVMADESSRRAIQNAISLIYGVKLPSEIYKRYAFATKLNNADRKLPQIHLILKNRLTQYMGSASAYAAVLSGIDQDLNELIKSNKDFFTFAEPSKGTVEVRDFGTTGVVAFDRGCPFSKLTPGKKTIHNKRTQVQERYIQEALQAIDKVAAHF